MLEQKIALLAKRMGIPTPRAVGNAHLGLMGTLRATQNIPLTFSQHALHQIAADSRGLSHENVIVELNRSDVWTWIETQSADQSWHWPERGEKNANLAAGSLGNIPSRGFALVLATSQFALRCAPAKLGDGLFVMSLLPRRFAPYARMLIARYYNGSTTRFDAKGLFQLIASQTLIQTRIDLKEIERESAVERDFITQARRHLETLHNYISRSTPQTKYELVDLSPLRLRTIDGSVWPAAFARPRTALQLRTEHGRIRTFNVAEVSDDGDVITLAGEAGSAPPVAQGELRKKPGDDSLKRMREALDAIAMEKHPAHGRLLAALTRPRSLEPLPKREPIQADAQVIRQDEAVALALATTDIALIHGPPGTGKTTVIARIVKELVRAGKRILMVAPTHVALDNVLERVGRSDEVSAIRLGSPDNVDTQAHRYLLQNRSASLTQELTMQLHLAADAASPDDKVAKLQRTLAERIRNDQEIGGLLLMNANLVCATPIGIAMAEGFQEVEVLFDYLIVDEASKATITDFLVPAARAEKWILVGDHRQLAPYVDTDELEAVVSERAERNNIPGANLEWLSNLSGQLKRHFDDRMHPNEQIRRKSWQRLVEALLSPMAVDAATFDTLIQMGPDPEKWRRLQRTLTGANPTSASTEARATEGNDNVSPSAGNTNLANRVRLGAELFELQRLALPSVFEHLTQLPADRAVRLNYQHRMTPALADFSLRTVYDGDYPSAPSTEALGLDIEGLESPSIWIDTLFAPKHRRYEFPRDPRREWSGGDYTNPLEVDIAMELIEYCSSWAVKRWHGDPRSPTRKAPFEIGVVCFYLKQALQIRDALFSKLGSGDDPWRRHWHTPAANGEPIDVHVSIVDRFQGREKDLIILCTTRSNPLGKRGHIDNLNRLNVAVTRARHKRIVIGDSRTLAGQDRGRQRGPDDLLVQLYKASESKQKWGNALGSSQ
jgi:hypothetical protein